MRLTGLLLLFSGLVLVMATLILLPGQGMRLAFLIAGMLVELLGMGLIAQHYRLAQQQRLVERVQP